MAHSRWSYRVRTIYLTRPVMLILMWFGEAWDRPGAGLCLSSSALGRVLPPTQSRVLPSYTPSVSSVVCRLPAGGGVCLGGVNGSAQVLGGAGAVDVQIEALERSEGSVLTTSTGPVNVHVVRHTTGGEGSVPLLDC